MPGKGFRDQSRCFIKAKILISLSLPKTGTTFLESLLSQIAITAVPRIKEPNFFFVGRKHESPALETLLSQGNYSRGLDWYKALYQLQEPDDVLVDFSTQYWLHPEQTIRNARKAFDPRFVIIKRPRIDQLVSYVSHLRRGHIECDRISSLYNNDADFSDYLARMSNWNVANEELRTKYPDETFIEISFEELISDPTLAIRKIFPGAAIGGETISNLKKNPRSHARIQSINTILFANTTRMFGRALPQFMYSGLIRLRKILVRMNLSEGHDRHFDDDRDFIIDTFN